MRRYAWGETEGLSGDFRGGGLQLEGRGPFWIETAFLATWDPRYGVGWQWYWSPRRKWQDDLGGSG